MGDFVRLFVSGALALCLLFFVIWFGYGVIRGGIGPLYEEPEGLPLRLEGEPSRDDIASLRAFLAKNPAERVTSALAREDLRFLGVRRGELEVPGLPAGRSLADSQVREIPGSGASYRSGDALSERARRYASAYNALLLRELTRLEAR